MIINNIIIIFTNNMNRILDYTTKHYSELLEVANNITKNKNEDSRDVCNELICELLELPQEKKDSIKDVKAYFIGMCKISVYYETSSYQNKYNKLKRTEDEIGASYLHQNPQMVNAQMKINLILNASNEDYVESFDYIESARKIIDRNLFWYEKIVFNMHVKDGITFEEMAKQTKIPKSSIYKIYISAKYKIKKSHDRKITRDRNQRLRENMEGQTNYATTGS